MTTTTQVRSAHHPDVIYTVRLYDDGVVECDCPAGLYGKQGRCWHIKQAVLEQARQRYDARALADRARLQGALASVQSRLALHRNQESYYRPIILDYEARQACLHTLSEVEQRLDAIAQRTAVAS